jgi:hypothetical protein
MSPEPNKIPANSADARRTQRILLQVPILVRAQFAGDEPIIEETKTLEVNAHGALIALAMKVRPGQKLFAEKLGYRQGTGVPRGTRARKIHRQK